MGPKSDAMAAPAPPQEFDQEIVDMAAYAHGYRVGSDLAVREVEKCGVHVELEADAAARLTLPASSSSTRSAAA